MKPLPDLAALQQRIKKLETENTRLRGNIRSSSKPDAVTVPGNMKGIFDAAQKIVGEYFRDLKMDPSKGTIEINDQRYVLVRASALSKGFLETIQNLYADRGKNEAFAIGRNFLFDYAHVIGMHDAKDFHAKMNLTDPISKLSAGPVHFAYSGWAFVDILPESRPTPDEDFFLLYNHPYSFEADSWRRAGVLSDHPVCIMNSGYSSGWCEESFGIQLTAVEVSCIAKGDERCTFIMSPPDKIQEHLEQFHIKNKNNHTSSLSFEIPTFFERKKVDEEMQRSRNLAEESAKTKSDFIANMSHELRTPLGAITGFTDLLKKTTLSPVQKDYLEAISTSGHSLLSIINDILDLSKLDAGRFIIENVPFSLPELVHSVQMMFSATAKKKGLKFNCSVDTAIAYPLSGDPLRLKQILVNLVGNAIKFTEAGGVYVSCIIEKETEQGVEVCFSVRDTGIGIPADKRETVFERFTQADSNTTRKYGGTGLGLAITKQLIELQGGSITLKKSETSGAEFCFTLPYIKLQQQLHKLPVSEPGLPLNFYSLKKILVVDDNLMNQKLASIILENNGFEITLAKNGKDVIRILKEQKFDLILMDIQMPLMDGYKTTQVIRDEMLIDAPIIAMTAHALSGEKEKCIKAGMNDYLSKPFKETDLLTKIAHWASRQKFGANCAYNDIVIESIDLSFLKEQTKNNHSFIQELIGIFRKQNPEDIVTLKQAVAAGHFAVIYKTAHLIRNTISFFGMHAVIGDELLCIEKMSLEKDHLEKIKLLADKVAAVCAQLVSELENIDLN